MSDVPKKPAEPDQAAQLQAPQGADALGRILFLVAGGVLLATMVSCACGPVR